MTLTLCRSIWACSPSVKDIKHNIIKKIGQESSVKCLYATGQITYNLHLWTCNFSQLRKKKTHTHNKLTNKSQSLRKNQMWCKETAEEQRPAA